VSSRLKLFAIVTKSDGIITHKVASYSLRVMGHGAYLTRDEADGLDVVNVIRLLKPTFKFLSRILRKHRALELPACRTCPFCEPFNGHPRAFLLFLSLSGVILCAWN
jgi:hypothetical protein